MGTLEHVKKPLSQALSSAPAQDAAAPKTQALRGQPYDQQARALAPSEQEGSGHDDHDHNHTHGREFDGDVSRAAPNRAAALAAHTEHQCRVDKVIRKALALPEPDKKSSPLARNVLLRNAAQWIEAKEADVSVMTPTDAKDQAARGLKPDQMAVFDKDVVWPAKGGTYRTGSDAGVDVTKSSQLGGMGVDGKTLTFVAPRSEELVEATLVHEVQHDADMSFKSQRWEEKPPPGLQEGFDPKSEGEMKVKAIAPQLWNNYKSEFRAFWIQGRTGDSEHDFGSAKQPAGNYDMVRGRKTNFKNERQEKIFWYMVNAKYQDLEFLYIKNAAFRDMVDDFTGPVSGNLVNSIRIERLADAIDGCSPGLKDDAPELVAVLTAAGLLDAADKKFLTATKSSAPFWGRAKEKLPTATVTKLKSLVAA